jgi:hypothetical protein
LLSLPLLPSFPFMPILGPLTHILYSPPVAGSDDISTL